MITYIYGLICPVANQLRYVGKTINLQRRIYEHCHRRGTSHKDRWLAQLARAGLAPEMVVLATVDHGDDWKSVERAEIAKARAAGCRLTNVMLGGEGGHIIDPEVDAYRIERARAAHKRPDVRAAKSRQMRSQWSTPEIRQRREAAMSQEQARARMSDAAKAKWADPAKGERARQANSSADKRAKLSESAKRRATPEYRAMMAEKTRRSWALRRANSEG